MRITTPALAVLILAGCASGQVARTGANEWAIGEAARDALHSDAAMRSRHYSRAQQICSDARVEPFDVTPADGRYHFRCIPPEKSTQQEITEAREAWLSCQQTAEPAVDDMISDGHTIAAVLATRCDSEVTHLLGLLSKGQPRWVMPDEALQRIRRQLALDVVLQVRAKKRNPDAVAPPVAVPQFGPAG